MAELIMIYEIHPMEKKSTFARLHFHSGHCCSRLHRMYILSLQSHVWKGSSKAFQWYANLSVQIIRHTARNIAEKPCMPSINSTDVLPSIGYKEFEGQYP